MRISEISVRRPVLALVISLLLLVLGVVSLMRLWAASRSAWSSCSACPYRLR